MKKFLLTFRNILLGCLGTFLLLSCQDGLYYTAYQPIPQSLWDSRDTLVYTLPVADHDMDVLLSVGVRSTDAYQYENLLVVVEQHCDQRKVAFCRLPIAIRNDGLYAHGHSTPLADDYSGVAVIHLKKGKAYTLRLSHRMKLNPLTGISEVGVFVEQSHSEGSPTIMR